MFIFTNQTDNSVGLICTIFQYPWRVSMKKYLVLIFQSLIVILIGLLLLFTIYKINPNLREYNAKIIIYIVDVGLIWFILRLKNIKK